MNKIGKILRNKEKYMPQKLFKYRAIVESSDIENNKHIDALINEKIYFSNPFNFNDPYDSVFSLNSEKIKESLIYLAKKSIVKSEFEKNGLDHIDLDSVNGIEQVGDNINLHNTELIDEVIEDNPNTFFQTFIKSIKFKIYCLSEVYDSILMWSHYANEHQGFCIGYNLSNFDEELKKELYPVFLS